MDYWEEAVSEAFDAEGVSATDAQIAAVGRWMKSAHECHQSGPVPELARAVSKPAEPDRLQQWWEDTSKLCGSDWVLARQIHSMINSR